MTHNRKHFIGRKEGNHDGFGDKDFIVGWGETGIMTFSGIQGTLSHVT